MEQAIHPRASQKQLAELTRSNPKPYGIFLTFDAFTQSLSSLDFGDLLKSPMILWHLQLRSQKAVQSPTITAIVVCEQLWPEGKKNNQIPLKRAKRIQQWKLFMSTLLKGIDYLLKTCTQAVSYSRFTQCKIPRTNAVVWISLYNYFLPKRQRSGKTRMGPRYQMQNTISQRICLPKFFTKRVLFDILAIFNGIQLSLRTVLISPSLYDSSC